MKLVVAGKGGAGKTTVAGTLARQLAGSGERVLALDCDANPMLGVSLGVGMERTELLVGVRQGVDEGEVAHEPTVAGMVETFGTDAPGGVRLVVASRIDRVDPGCPWCGVSPEQLLREFEAERSIVVGDLEAGVGTLLRLQPGQADLVLVIAQPTAKAIEVARRAVEIASSRARVILVANRVRGEADVELIRDGVGSPGVELVAIPDDDAIARADEEGRAPFDVAPDAPAVLALAKLAEAIRASVAPA